MAFWLMPNGRYKRDLLELIYSFKEEVIRLVTEHEKAKNELP
jgi:hypothetical protein